MRETITPPHKLLLGSLPLRFKRSNLDQQETGFTLIEMLVVVVIISVLAGIVAPSWLAFTRQRQATVARDQILSAVQDAQRQAKLRKTTYRAIVRVNNGVPQVTVASSGIDVLSSTYTGWKQLGDGQVKVGLLTVGTNINSGSNTLRTTPVAVSGTTLASITFDYLGGLPVNSSTSLNITVATPLNRNSTQPVPGTRRCVIVRSLLGTVVSERGNNCVSW